MHIKELIYYEKNAKEHSTKQIDQICESIKNFGFNVPLVIDKNNVIVAGHGRYLACYKMGWEEIRLGVARAPKGERFIPAVRAEELSEEEIQAYRLADNKLNESLWDMKLVLPELQELNLSGFDMTLTGFSSDLLVSPDEKDDIVPDNTQPVAKIGDLLALGKHRLMCGDSTKESDVARLMNGKKADMVFTDPPYGVNYTGKAEHLGREGNSQISGDASVAEASAVYGEAFKRISENIKDGSVYYVCSPQGGDMEMMMMMSSTIPCRHQIIWKKDSPVFSMGRLDYDYQHEPILYGWRGSHKHVGNGKHKTSVWEIPRPKKSKLHPTMKPVELVENAILNSSNENEIVLDLFMGGGSTLIACEKTGRVCYGMELDPKYVDVCVARWEKYTGQKATKI